LGAGSGAGAEGWHRRYGDVGSNRTMPLTIDVWTGTHHMW